MLWGVGGGSRESGVGSREFALGVGSRESGARVESRELEAGVGSWELEVGSLGVFCFFLVIRERVVRVKKQKTPKLSTSNSQLPTLPTPAPNSRLSPPTSDSRLSTRTPDSQLPTLAPDSRLPPQTPDSGRAMNALASRAISALRTPGLLFL
jgi:hypothetical protein